MLEILIKEKVINRCLAAVSFCLEFGNDRRANTLMKEEFGEIARDVALLQLSGESKADLFLLPMQEELMRRYGQEMGGMLFGDFLDAFWLQTWTDIPLNPVKLERAQALLIDWHVSVQASRRLRQRVAKRHYLRFNDEN